MHQLALAFKSLGLKVYGYDAKPSSYTKLCEENDIKITHKYTKEFLQVDLCVKTGAIPDNNRFLIELRKKNTPIVDRAEALAWFCKKFKNVIAVAGTHGKSTTASLIYKILQQANKKVSCHIGADVDAPRFCLNDDFLVVEACEYQKSFLRLYPTISVVTNIEKEHMDCYGSLFNLRNSFLTFLKRAPNRFVYKEKSTTFLQKYKNINFVNSDDFDYTPILKGEHNKKNIALAVAVARHLDIDEQTIKKVVNNFKGLSRRYDYLGNFENTKIYIDYAHHPTEVDAFIQTFKKQYPNSLVVFQPHTYSRTKLLLKEFLKVFSKLNDLVLYKEYPAREKPTAGMTCFELYQQILKINKNVKYLDNKRNIQKIIKNYDAVAFVGAGDINKVAQKLI